MSRPTARAASILSLDHPRATARTMLPWRSVASSSDGVQYFASFIRAYFRNLASQYG